MLNLLPTNNYIAYTRGKMSHKQYVTAKLLEEAQERIQNGETHMSVDIHRLLVILEEPKKKIVVELPASDPHSWYSDH